MATTAIKFNDFFNYFRNELDALNEELYYLEHDVDLDLEENQGDLEKDRIISTDFDIEYFKEVARYFNIDKESYIKQEADTRTKLLCLITEGQLVQETKNPFPIYLQPIGFQMRFDESKLEDGKTLIREFLVRNKEKEVIIGGKTVIISPDSGFTEERDIQHGTRVMIVSFSINVTILDQVFYSNNASITISGREIKTLTLHIQRTTEIVPDLRKTISQKFYPNSTTYVVTISGYYTESNRSVSDLIEGDLMKASNFNQPYPVMIYRYKGVPAKEKLLLSDSMLAKDIEVSFVQGSIAAFSASFYSMVVL